jgi:KUP system potassium uptake protein
MREIVEHLHALSEHVVILSIDTRPVPHVPPAQRIVIDDLGYSDDGISHVEARFGYMDAPNVPEVLGQIDQTQLEAPIDADGASYFLSTVDLTLSDAPGMSQWRKRLFLATAHITADAAEFFHLPRERTVIVGSQIDV